MGRVCAQKRRKEKGEEATHSDLEPGGGGVVAVRTLEGAGVHVRPLVVLHVRAAVEGRHADPTGEALGVLTRGAPRGGGLRGLTAQLATGEGLC